MASADLAILITAHDQAGSVLDGLRGKIGGFGAAIGTGIMAAGAGIAAGVAIGVKAAGDLEQSVANISTIKPDIDTSAVFASLNEMQTRIPQSAAALGEGLYDIFSSVSVNQEQALQLLETFGKGATGAGTDAKTFGTSVMGVMNAYGLSVEDAAHISDVFFNTVNQGVVTGEELAASLGPVTQSAKAAGVGLNEMGAMIAAVTKEGGPAAQNINNLNNFLQKITTKEAQAQIEALGIKTKDATGSFRPTADVLTDLKGKLEGMTESARANALQAIFPDAQARQGAMTLISQLDLVKSATLENATAQGVADAAYAKMSATFNSQMTLLKGSLMSVLTTIGGALLPTLTPLVTAFSQWLPGAFQQAQAALGPLATSLSASLVPAFQAVMAALPTIIGLFQNLFDVFSGGDSFDAAAEVLDSIFGPQVTDVILFFVEQAGNAFRTVAAAFSEAFAGVSAWFTENLPLIQQLVMQILTGMAALWKDHGEQIVAIVEALWTIVSTGFSTGFQIVGGLIRAFLQLMTGDWQGALATLGDVMSTAWEGIKTIFGAALTALANILDLASGGMLTKMDNWMSDTATAIKDGMQAIVDGVSSGWNAVQDFVGGILPAIRDAIMRVWNLIPEDIRTDAELILTTLVSRGAAWVTSVGESAANMLTAISTGLAQMVAAITTWATSTFLAPITGLSTSAGTAATNVGSGMLTAITGKLGEIVSAIGGWVGQVLAPIVGLIGTAGSAAQSVGQAIVDGIRNAINNGIGAIRDAAHRAARAALDAAKSALGIESPSKVFQLEVGKMIPEGIIRGIQQMQRPLDSTISALVAPPAAPSYALSGGSFSGGSGGVVVNFHGPVYGFDDFTDKVIRANEEASRRGRG